MKQLFAFLLLMLSASASAEVEIINLGEMEAGKEYALADFKGYKGYFTPEESGVLTFSSTTTDDMEPFSDEACTKKVKITKNGEYGAHNYDMKVEAGQTYWFYTSCVWNTGTKVSFSVSGVVELKLKSTSPAEGEVFNPANGGQISFNFNKAVAFSGATITIGGKTQDLAGRTYTNSIYFNDTKELVYDAMKAGTLKQGDKFRITISGVRLAADNTVLYNGTGTVEGEFTVSKMPASLVSTENTKQNFLSFYSTTNPQGLVKFHFSGKVSTEQMKSVIKYGSIDLDEDGGYYYEQLVPTLEDDSTTVVINLQGKRRKITDMISDGNTYETIDLGLVGVLDEDGNYAYAPGSGSLGSYWYRFDYKEINAQVFAEFTPSSGKELTTANENIEIWLTDEDKLSYDGIEFLFTVDAKQESVLVTDFTKDADPDDNQATIITVSIPDQVREASEVTVSFKNLQCADGSDYSETLTAHYSVVAGIKEVNASADSASVSYNLAGQRVNSSVRGVLIESGRKVIR